MQYYEIDNYAMKCRLYPSKTQKQAIDNALTAVRVFHNCLVYDMWNNKINVTEKKKKSGDEFVEGEFVHFPDLKSALKSDYKAKLIKDHPIIEKCPAAALTTNVGLKADLIKEFEKKPIEYKKPTYYNELHQRLSYTYQEPLSKIKFRDNHNVFYVDLSKIGIVKVRGWNKKLCFDNKNIDFLEWAELHSKEQITVTVSKDLVGDYYIVFKIKHCQKPFSKSTNKKIGIDVGIKNIAIPSYGEPYENKKFKKSEKRHQKLINRKMARRW